MRGTQQNRSLVWQEGPYDNHTAPRTNPHPQGGFGIDHRLGVAALRIPAASREDFRPQAILKFHCPSCLNYKACHGHPIPPSCMNGPYGLFRIIVCYFWIFLILSLDYLAKCYPIEFYHDSILFLKFPSHDVSKYQCNSLVNFECIWLNYKTWTW